MLIAITLTLRAQQDGLLPQHVGRANYAAVLARLNTIDQALSKQIHQGDGFKPLTCSGLLNAHATRAGLRVKTDTDYYVRVTGLTELVSSGLQEALLAQAPATWTLDDHPFLVTAATCTAEENPWSGLTNYETLGTESLLSIQKVDRTVTLRFASPTSFKLTHGMHMPVPLPGLVFGSLVDRWNCFSNVTVSGEMRRFGEQMVAISSYSLRSRPVSQKQGSLRMGGLGVVSYQAMGNDWYWVRIMHMLAAFAKYSGVGILTTAGMGQACKIEEHSKPSQRNNQARRLRTDD